jgi:hypothetical protein
MVTPRDLPLGFLGNDICQPKGGYRRRFRDMNTALKDGFVDIESGMAP